MSTYCSSRRGRIFDKGRTESVWHIHSFTQLRATGSHGLERPREQTILFSRHQLLQNSMLLNPVE